MDKVAIFKEHIYKQANLFTTKDVIKDIPGKNITLITGYSGSGKSTLGEQLEKQSPNNIFIELDGFEHGYDTTNSNGVVSRFEKKHGLVSAENFEDMMPKILDHIKNEAKNNPENHYYVDGIQLLEYPDLFKEYPSIIKGTGVLKSSYRKFNRPTNSRSFPECVKFNTRFSKNIDDIKRNVREKTAIYKQAKLNDDVQLYPHQQRAINREGDGVIYAHSVGSGKTLTAIARFEKLKSEGKANKALVVVPAGLRSNFHDEGVHKFTDSKSNIVGNSAEVGKRLYGGIDTNSDYNIVSYEMFRKDPMKYIKESGADTLITDESHRGKNEGTATTESLKRYRKYFKNYVGLTGSVVSNSVADIQPLVDVAANGNHLLGKNKKEFEQSYISRSKDKQYRGLPEKRIPVSGFNNKRTLQKELSKYVDYTDYDDVKELAKMPNKITTVDKVPISREQAELYKRIINKNPEMKKLITMKRLETLKDEDAAKAFSNMIEARKLMNSVGSVVPGISLKDSANRTPKTRKLLDDVDNHLRNTPDGQAILLTHLVNGGTDVLEEGLKQRHIPYGKFIGKGNQGVTEESRLKDVDDFNHRKKRVMIISSAGGEGLSLNDTTWEGVLDPHYNPEKMKQMEARGIRSGGLNHRPKEQRNVDVHRYMATMPKTFGVFKSSYKTPDEVLYEIANNKDQQNQHLFNLLKENNRRYERENRQRY